MLSEAGFQPIARFPSSQQMEASCLRRVEVQWAMKSSLLNFREEEIWIVASLNIISTHLNPSTMIKENRRIENSKLKFIT